MKNGMKEKRGEHVKNVKRLAGEAEKSYLCHRRHARCFAICSYKRGNESSIVSYIIIMGFSTDTSQLLMGRYKSIIL
jgi:hypothetical protein